MQTALSKILGFVLVVLVFPMSGQSTGRPKASSIQPVASVPVVGETETSTPNRTQEQSLNGRWNGQLVIPGNQLTLSLNITQNNGQTMAVIEAPATLLNHHQMLFTQQHDTLRFFDPAAQASFIGTRSLDGSQLLGQWQQPGFSQRLAMNYEPPVAPARTMRTTKWSTGILENNRPVGTWQYFRPKAHGHPQLVEVYDHNSNQVLFNRPDSSSYNVELTPGKWSKTVLTESPWFIGGLEEMASYLNKLQYPALAWQRHIEGVVTVGFTLDPLGRATDFTVTRSLGNGCDEEAMRVAQTIPNT